MYNSLRMFAGGAPYTGGCSIACLHLGTFRVWGRAVPVCTRPVNRGRRAVRNTNSSSPKGGQ